MFRLAAKFHDYVWRTLVYCSAYEKEDQQLILSDLDRLRYALRCGDRLQLGYRSKISNKTFQFSSQRCMLWLPTLKVGET